MLFMSVTPSLIVAEARSWLGTRFHHQGRLKKTATHKGGCDCIGLVVGVVRDLALPYAGEENAHYQFLYECDRTDYERIPNGKELRQALVTHLQEITLAEIAPGDALLFCFDQNPQHVAIVSDYPYGGLGIIHCYMKARQVVENRLDESWQRRLVGAFRFKI